MPRKPETTFTQSIHSHFGEQKPHFEKQNNMYRGGIWDYWYSGKKGDWWIEYKFIKVIPVRVGVKPYDLLSPLQRSWGISRHKEGRQTGVIVGSCFGGIWLPTPLWLHHEILPEDWKGTQVQTRKQLAQMLELIVGPGVKEIA